MKLSTLMLKYEDVCVFLLYDIFFLKTVFYTGKCQVATQQICKSILIVVVFEGLHLRLLLKY